MSTLSDRTPFQDITERQQETDGGTVVVEYEYLLTVAVRTQAQSDVASC